MSVEFNEPSEEVPARFHKKESLLLRGVIGMGLAKDKKGAEKILLILAVVAIVLAIAYMLTSGIAQGQARAAISYV